MPRRPPDNTIALRLILDYQASGDKHLIQQLFESYKELSSGAFLKYTQDKEVTKDLNQDLFLVLIDKLTNASIKNYASWLKVVCRNMAMDHQRKQTREQSRREAYKKGKKIGEDIVEEPELERLESIRLEQLTQQQLDDAMARLTPEQRDCIYALYRDGLSYKEIAAKYGYQFREVKSKLRMAMYHLRKNVKQ